MRIEKCRFRGLFFRKIKKEYLESAFNEFFSYLQVTYTLHGESPDATDRIKEREYRPFRAISDGYPRYIISLDRYRDQQEGVKHINAIDLFLGKEFI